MYIGSFSLGQVVVVFLFVTVVNHVIHRLTMAKFGLNHFWVAVTD